MIRIAVAANLLLTATVAAQGTPTAPTADLLREEVRFANGDTPLAATLLRVASSQRQPAVVIVHGSGESDRTNPWTTAWAEALAREGLVVLHTDKRGSGASGGDWLTASFETLADDAAAGLWLLRERPEVDPERVGAIGFSQGGYIVSLLAEREPDCRCVASVSGGTRTMLDQVVDELLLEAESEGGTLPPADSAAIHDAYAQFMHAAQGRLSWDEASRVADAARALSPRVEHALRTLPGEASHPAVGWARLVGEFDPLPHWSAVKQPALFIYGGKDSQVRVQDSLDRLWSLPPGHRDIVVFGDSGHALFRADGVVLMARWFAAGGEG